MVVFSAIDNLVKGAAGQAGAEHEFDVWSRGNDGIDAGRNESLSRSLALGLWSLRLKVSQQVQRPKVKDQSECYDIQTGGDKAADSNLRIWKRSISVSARSCPSRIWRIPIS